jgi:hypothetical protein
MYRKLPFSLFHSVFFSATKDSPNSQQFILNPPLPLLSLQMTYFMNERERGGEREREGEGEFSDFGGSVCSTRNVIRVTRLGEFTPMYWAVVYSGQFFLKRKKVVQVFGPLCPRGKLCTNFDKKEFGYVLGDFFHPLIRSP